MAALAAGFAAGSAGAQTWRIVPSFGVTPSYSDNANPTPGEEPKSGWITALAPAIRADVTGPRVKGLLDYRLNYTSYSHDSRLNTSERFLNSFAKVQAAGNWLFVDARADINQQNRSAFGLPVTPGVPIVSRNRVETATWQVAPYIRGRISDIATYQLRVNETGVRTTDIGTPEIGTTGIGTPDTRTTEWAGRITDATPSAKIGWAVDARALNVRGNLVESLKDSRVRGSVTYTITPSIRVSVSEGYETTDFAGPPRRSDHTPGLGLEWSPGPRTQLSAVYEKRFFGTGHNVLFSHRTPLTAFKLVSTKDATVLPAQLTGSGLFSIQSLMSDLLTSAIRDPEERAQAVRRRLEETGISGTSALNTNVLVTRPFAFRATAASFALLGAINTMTLSFSSREQRSFGDTPVILGDEDFRQTGFDANLARKLSAFTTLTFTATSWRTESLTIAARRSRQHLYRLFFTTQLGPRTSGSVGFRRTDFVSATGLDSYRENAIFGSVSIHL